MAGKKIRKKKESLRPDTTLAPVEEPEAEVYVWGLPVCCLAALKDAVVSVDDRQLSELRCRCGRGWYVTSSLDERVLGRFATYGGPRVSGGSYPAA